MNEITITMSQEEAEAVCFALFNSAGGLDELLQDCFNHPASEVDRTPDEVLEAMWLWRVYRDAMNAVRERLTTAKIAAQEESKV